MTVSYVCAIFYLFSKHLKCSIKYISNLDISSRQDDLIFASLYLYIK